MFEWGALKPIWLRNYMDFFPYPCDTWPDGMGWAGGVVYDLNECPHPSMAMCSFEELMTIPGCHAWRLEPFKTEVDFSTGDWES